jgi:undecaprenyl-diphosphatase
MIVSVFGGVKLNNLLKLAFARPRPDILYEAVQAFTSSFPSGHAELSAIAYLTMAALWRKANPLSRLVSTALRWQHS